MSFDNLNDEIKNLVFDKYFSTLRFRRLLSKSKVSKFYFEDSDFILT